MKVKIRWWKTEEMDKGDLRTCTKYEAKMRFYHNLITPPASSFLLGWLPYLIELNWTKPILIYPKKNWNKPRNF